MSRAQSEQSSLVTTLREEAEAARGDAARHASRVEVLSRQLREAEGTIKALEGRITDTTADIARTRRSAETHVSEGDELRRQLAAAARERESLLGQVSIAALRRWWLRDCAA